jgi:hypothetical protein
MKPVAWMYEKPNGASKLSFVKEKMLWEDMTETPLYAHPAKTLTDEEIQELALSDEFWISEDCTIFDWHKFARAILKKGTG